MKDSGKFWHLKTNWNLSWIVFVSVYVLKSIDLCLIFLHPLCFSFFWNLHEVIFVHCVFCSSTADVNMEPKRKVKLREDWREKSKPIPPGGTYPAKDHCRFCPFCFNSLFVSLVLIRILGCFNSRCGLCDTYYIAHVKDACAFLGDGMSRIEVMSI